MLDFLSQIGFSQENDYSKWQIPYKTKLSSGFAFINVQINSPDFVVLLFWACVIDYSIELVQALWFMRNGFKLEHAVNAIFSASLIAGLMFFHPLVWIEIGIAVILLVVSTIGWIFNVPACLEVNMMKEIFKTIIFSASYIHVMKFIE